jgi:hypothetical protein
MKRTRRQLTPQVEVLLVKRATDLMLFGVSDRHGRRLSLLDFTIPAGGGAVPEERKVFSKYMPPHLLPGGQTTYRTLSHAALVANNHPAI